MRNYINIISAYFIDVPAYCALTKRFRINSMYNNSLEFLEFLRRDLLYTTAQHSICISVSDDKVSLTKQ